MDKNEILNSDWCVRRNAAENPKHSHRCAHRAGKG